MASSAPADHSGVDDTKLVESSDWESRGGNVAKKAAWRKPTNSVAEAEVVMSPVMGAVCWPALCESTININTKSSPKSLDGSISLSQGMGMLSSSHRQANTKNAFPNSTSKRSMKRGGNSNHKTSANGGFSQQQPQQGSEVEIATNNSAKSCGHSGVESSSRDNSHRNGVQWGGFGSQSYGGNEHHLYQRNSSRRGSICDNVSPHPRGDGTFHHGYEGKRDQERGNQDWNPHRGWGNRDNQVQPQRGPVRPFIQGHPHTSPPFIPPPIPLQPYQTPMVYPEVPPVFYFPGPHPMFAPMPPVFFPLPDPELHTNIVNQIAYYFSNENLIKDTFLRQNMDEHGWVPVTLIAGFKKVMQLTDNIPLILDTVRSSTVVEVQGEKIRRRNDWNRWIMPPPVHNSTATSTPQSLQRSSPDFLAENLQSIVIR